MFNRNSFGEPKVIYILSIILFFLLIFLGVKEFQNSDVTIRKYFVPALFLKLTCGIGIGLLYSRYYSSGDTFAFFEDGACIAGLLKNSLLQFVKFLWNGDHESEIWSLLHYTQPRALFFSKLTAVGYALSFGNYWILSVLFSFLSFYAAWKFVERIVEYFPASREEAVIAFLFFPSVVFWSSGVLKESIAMAGLFAVAYVFIKYWIRNKISFGDVLILIGGCWLLWNLKYYFAGLLLVSIGAMILVRIILRRYSIDSPIKIVFVFVLVLVIPMLLVTQLHPNFYTSRILEVVVKNYEAYRAISEPGNLIGYYQLKATLGSVFLNSPWALISGMFRPFIWEARSILQVVAGTETLLVLILFFNMIKHYKRISLNPNLLLLLGVVTYITLLAIFLSLSTPNMGTLARYRVGFYPFLIYLLLLANPWITQRNRFLSK